MVERATAKRGSEIVMESGRGKKETGTRGTKTEKGRENERETGRGNVNGSATGIGMGDEIVGIDIAGMRGTGRNALRLENPLGSRGSLQGKPLRSPLRRQWRRPLDLQIPRPGIDLPSRVRMDWVNDGDLLTMT